MVENWVHLLHPIRVRWRLVTSEVPVQAVHGMQVGTRHCLDMQYAWAIQCSDEPPIHGETTPHNLSCEVPKKQGCV